MFTITLHDFADAFGVQVKDLSKECIEAYNKVEGDLLFDLVRGEERDKLIVDILKRIEVDTQKIGSPERTEIWQKGWQENLDTFRISPTVDSLRPKYYRPHNIMRWNGQYIKPYSSDFEISYYSVFQKWLFSYFESFENIYEFGCGSGINLCELAKMYLRKSIFGSDFVLSAVQLATALGIQYGGRISGFTFDMTRPDYSIKLKPNSAVLTSGALEQLASIIEPFFNYLLENKPKICVFAEPIIEVYDDKELLDYLAIKFHRKRGYTEGILPWLRRKEAEGRVEILKVQRQGIGSIFWEGWTIIIWKPKY